MALPTQLSDAAWQQRVFITAIRKSDGKKVNFAALIDDVDFSGGEKGHDSIATGVGGRIRNRNPQDDIAVSVTMYPVVAGTDEISLEGIDGERTGGIEEFYLESGDLASEAAVQEFGTTLERNDYILVFTLTNDDTIEYASDAISGEDVKAYRRVMQRATFDNATSGDMTDQIWSIEAEISCPPFTPQGERAYKLQGYLGDETEELAEITVE